MIETTTQDIILQLIYNQNVQVIASLILVNYLVAIFVAYKNKELVVGKLWEVLLNKFILLIGTYFTFDLVEQSINSGFLDEGVLLVIIGRLVPDLLDNLNKIPSLSPYIMLIPDFLKKVKPSE